MTGCREKDVPVTNDELDLFRGPIATNGGGEWLVEAAYHKI